MLKMRVWSEALSALGPGITGLGLFVESDLVLGLYRSFPTRIPFSVFAKEEAKSLLLRVAGPTRLNFVATHAATLP